MGTPGGATGGAIPRPNIPSLPQWALAPATKTEDPADWRRWWEYNQDAYLDLSGRLHGSLSAAEESFDASGVALDYPGFVRARLDAKLRELIGKAGGTNPYVASAVLALAKSAPESESTELDPVLEYYLHEGTVDLRGVAALALAVEGRAGVRQALQSLLADDAEGRGLARAEPVPARLRAFAAYGLGLVGSRTGEVEERTEIARVLFGALRDPKLVEEVRIASVIAVGLVPVDDLFGPPGCDCGGIGHEPETCRLSEIAWLCDVLGDATQPAAVRVHVPTALARLLPGMSEEVRGIVVDALLPVLEKGTSEFGSVRQSAAIALGELSLSGASEIDRRIRNALERTAGFGDEASRRLALIALARGAGKPGAREASVRDATNFLEQSLASSQNRIRPWAAVALGVLAHELRRTHQPVPGDLPAALRSALERARSSDEFAACALGAGLCGDPTLADALLAGLQSFKEDTARGMAALGLGLAGARSAVPALQAVLAETQHRPEVHGRAALALGLLGDDTLVPALVERLKSAPAPDVRVSLARTLGAIGSPEALAALLGIVEDLQGPVSARTAALQALGTLAAREGAAWSARLGPNQNYLAPCSTLTNSDRMGVLDVD